MFVYIMETRRIIVKNISNRHILKIPKNHIYMYTIIINNTIRGTGIPKIVKLTIM